MALLHFLANILVILSGAETGFAVILQFYHLSQNIQDTKHIRKTIWIFSTWLICLSGFATAWLGHKLAGGEICQFAYITAMVLCVLPNQNLFRRKFIMLVSDSKWQVFRIISIQLFLVSFLMYLALN